MTTRNTPLQTIWAHHLGKVPLGGGGLGPRSISKSQLGVGQKATCRRYLNGVAGHSAGDGGEGPAGHDAGLRGSAAADSPADGQGKCGSSA